MHNIILAAGEGKRLRPLTNEIPKCLVKIGDTPLLYRQIETLKKFNPNKITVVAGYLYQNICYDDISIIVNENYASTNMVYTLFCAENQIYEDENLIITYGDILFEESAISELLNTEGDVVICINRKWRELWEMRMENPLEDAETLKITDINKITEIGKKPNSFEDIDGQYMGIIKVSHKFVKNFKAFWQHLKKDGMHRGEFLNNLYLTDYIQLLIEHGTDVRACFVDGGWIEVDTIDDLETYNAMIHTGTLEKLIKLSR